jgi:hypothetical protein
MAISQFAVGMSESWPLGISFMRIWTETSTAPVRARGGLSNTMEATAVASAGAPNSEPGLNGLYLPCHIQLHGRRSWRDPAHSVIHASDGRRSSDLSVMFRRHILKGGAPNYAFRRGARGTT